jgi:hypothetical protein
MDATLFLRLDETGITHSRRVPQCRVRHSHLTGMSKCSATSTRSTQQIQPRSSSTHVLATSGDVD